MTEILFKDLIKHHPYLILNIHSKLVIYKLLTITSIFGNFLHLYSQLTCFQRVISSHRITADTRRVVSVFDKCLSKLYRFANLARYLRAFLLKDANRLVQAGQLSPAGNLRVYVNGNNDE